MAALKKSMRWDEETFDLECDLDHYMIVAVGGFNLGRWRTRALTSSTPNTCWRDPDVATDVDFENIDRVVAHEVFPQLDRQPCLPAATGSALAKGRANGLPRSGVRRRHAQPRTARIREGARPARRSSRRTLGRYGASGAPVDLPRINNFYTATVYERAEVVRMIPR